MAFTGGSLWFTYQPGSCSYYGTTSLGRIDPATGDVHLDLAAVPAASFPYALSDRPDRMILQNNLGRLSVYDVSGHSPALVAQRSHSVSRPDCRGAALLAGGEKVITACNYADKAEVFYTADLSEAPALVPGSGPYALAVSADGRQIATGWGASDGCHLRVWDIKASTPGSFVGSYDFDPSFYSPGFAFAYSATGRLYAVRSVGDQNAVLRVVSEPAKCPTKPTLEINRKAVPYQGTAGAFGSLRHSPGGRTTAALTRTDRTGSHDLGTVPVNADGTFRLTDTPGVTGAVVYSVSYAGDETHGPGGAKAVAFVHPLAYDVNADNRADAIVGVPGEDLGSTSNAGMFHLLYGAASGVSGSGSKVYHQSTAGVPGVPEAGDQFGYANASGDFNADGYADVAVSAPAEDLASPVDAGGVWVFYGSSAGLRTDNITTLTLDHTYLRGTPGVRFGHALASGDFDADGRDDLAIGAPGGEAVFVAPGTETGLSRDHIDNFDENTPDVPGVKRSGDRFGWSLAALNVNGDTHSDLAVGAPYDSDDHGYATGSVTVWAAATRGWLELPGCNSAGRRTLRGCRAPQPHSGRTHPTVSATPSPSST